MQTGLMYLPLRMWVIAAGVTSALLKTVCSNIHISSVTDRGNEECVDPEGNGVTMSEGAEGGPGLPSGEQDKQSVCSSGGDKTSMGEPKRQLDGLDVTSRPHHAQSM
jgi:hypothetical protein